MKATLAAMAAAVGGGAPTRPARCAASRPLPAEQRDALLLVHGGGLSHREAAEACGIPPGTVKSRLRLGLARVRDDLGA